MGIHINNYYHLKADLDCKIWTINKEIKPSKVIQHCFVCGEELVKGEIRFKMLKGEIYGRVPAYLYAHELCFVIEMKKLMGNYFNYNKRMLDEMRLKALD